MNQIQNQTVVAFAVCADNNDPWGAGRIRVITDNDFVPPTRTALNIQSYLNKLDADNANQNPDTGYIAWELGANGHTPDPYVVEPFLPKHLNVIPKIGESVKVIYYVMGDQTQQREYVGPHVSTYDRLTFDSVETGRVFTKKTTYCPQPNNLRNTGLIPDVNDVALSGRNNSEVVLPDGAVILRAGHQNFVDNIKNNRNALFQASFFPIKKNLTTNVIPIDNTPIVPITYIMEFLTTVSVKTADNPLYIQTIIYIYKTDGVNSANYSAYANYLPDPTQAEYQFVLQSSTTGNILSFLTNFIKSMDNGYMLDPLLKFKNTNTLQIINIIDNRTSETGAALDNTYNLRLYQVRASITTDLSVAEAAAIESAMPIGLHPASMAPTKEIDQTTEDVTTDNLDSNETVIISGADKLFLLSWNAAIQLQNSISKYGFTQDDIYLTLQKNTQAMVKGDLLLNLIMDLLDLIEQHSHSGLPFNPGATLTDNATTLISNIKDKYGLNNPVANDLTGGSLILNQYLRLN